MTERRAGVGALVQRYRRESGLSQEELARRSGVSVRTIRDLEGDRTRWPHRESLARLAQALGLPVGALDIAPGAVDSGPAPGTTAASTRVRVLGPLALVRHDAPVRVGGSAIRGVLAMLALDANYPVSTDQLATAVWPEEPPRTWLTQVHTAVSRLRRWLAPDRPDRLERVSSGYVLWLAEKELDLLEFRSMVRAAAAIRDTNGTAALDLLARAMDLWRGPVCADDMRLRQNPRSVATSQECVEALLGMADLAAELQAYDRVTHHLHRAVTHEPYHEGLHARLMLAMAGLGDRAGAGRVFADLRHRLVEDLGVEPSEQVLAIQQLILRDEVVRPAPTWARAAELEAGGLPVHPASLPGDIADFTGRERDVSELGAALTAAPGPPADHGGPNVVGVSGMAGVGKTTIAVHVAHRASPHFPDGQLYIDLRGHAATPLDPADVLARLLRALGIEPAAMPLDAAERGELYRSVLARRRVLILLDNAASADQVRPLLPGAGRSAVLVTSRPRLPGIGYRHQTNLDVFDTERAVELLARVVSEQRLAGQAGAARQLAELCGGLPLAVRIVAARLVNRPRWHLQHMVRLLGDERSRLDRLAVGDLAVRASLSLSYDGLAPAAALLLRRIALFDQPEFPLWFIAATMRCGIADAVEPVEALLDAQLLSETGEDAAGQPRFRLHDLVRLYARERAADDMSGADRLAVIAGGLSAWLAVAEGMAAGVPGPCFAVIHCAVPRPAIDWDAAGLTEVAPLEWFDLAHTSIESAVRQACAAGLDDLAFDLAGCLEKYFDVRGMYAEWAATNEHAIAACHAAGNVLGEAVMLRGLIDVRTWNGRHGANTAMARLHEEACRLEAMFTAVGSTAGASDAAVMISWGLSAQGDQRGALDCGRRALRMAVDAGHLGGQARAYVAIALAQAESQDIRSAAAALRRALRLARRIKNPRYEATALQFLGMAQAELGEWDEAAQTLQQSLLLGRTYRDHYVEALTLAALAGVQLQLGDPAARSTGWAALRLSRRYNMSHHVGEARWALGRIELAAQQYERAIEHLEEAARIFRSRGWRSRHAAVLVELGHACRPVDADAAREHWRRSRELFAQLHNESMVEKLTTLALS